MEPSRAPHPLEALAAALPREQFSTALVAAGGGRGARLTVVHRNAPDYPVSICVDAGWFCWVWGERIAPAKDAALVAEAARVMLRPFRPVMSRPRPGFGEIALTVPALGQRCSDRAHAQAGRPATVLVTFGELGTGSGGLWRGCWHQPVPMCGRCWQATQRAAAAHRPGLIVHDFTGAWAALRPSGSPA